jgi:ribosomal protein L24
MVVDSKGNVTRIGRRKTEKGKSVRYAKKTGEDIK